MKTASTIFTLLALGLLLTYCAEQINNEDVMTDGPYFPRQLAFEGERDQMEALLTGELIFENNCFLIRDKTTNTQYSPIWPPDFDYQLTIDSVFVILNASGHEVARTGAGIRLSGGEVRESEALEGQIEDGPEKLVLTCPVPYWWVGNEISVFELEAQLPASAYTALSAWFDFYDQHITDWRPYAFELKNKWRLDSLHAVPFQDVYPIEDRPEKWLIPSPDRQYNLDIYARDVVVETGANGARTAYALSPDSEAAIEDPAAGTRRRVIFCGTPCRFEDGYWEDRQILVIAGLHQGEEDQFHPTIWRVNLNDLLVQQYTYPTPLVKPFPYNYVQEVIFGDFVD